jgi:hypothetical protein
VCFAGGAGSRQNTSRCVRRDRESFAHRGSQGRSSRCGRGAGCEGSVGQFVDTFSAVDLQLKDGFTGPGGVGDLPLCDGGELRLPHEQYVDVVADDDGLRGLVREFVVGEAELGEEAGGHRQVLRRKVDRNSGGHGFSCTRGGCVTGCLLIGSLPRHLVGSIQQVQEATQATVTAMLRQAFGRPVGGRPRADGISSMTALKPG